MFSGQTPHLLLGPKEAQGKGRGWVRQRHLFEVLGYENVCEVVIECFGNGSSPLPSETYFHRLKM